MTCRRIELDNATPFGGALLSRFRFGGESDELSAPFQMSRFWLEPGQCTYPEDHPDKELWCVICGGGQLRLDDDLHEMRAGDAMFIEPGVSHSITNTGSDVLVIMSAWWS
jgi:quercetin dioxygenase-like cupin family protein